MIENLLTGALGVATFVLLYQLYGWDVRNEAEVASEKENRIRRNLSGEL